MGKIASGLLAWRNRAKSCPYCCLTGCGKTRLRACFGKGTSLLVPICPLLLSLRGGFSRRGICFSEFFRNLLNLGEACLRTARRSRAGGDAQSRKLGIAITSGSPTNRTQSPGNLACFSCSNSPVIYSGRLRRQHATQACVLGHHLSRDVRVRATTRCARAACGASRTRGSAGTIARQDLVGPYGRQQALRSWQTEAARRGQCSRVADEVTAPESHGAELLRQPRASGVSL